MLRVIIIVLVIAVALLRGGSLSSFAALPLRWPALAILGFALQLLIFTPFARAPLIAVATAPLYTLSLALVAVWVARNWRIPGMALIAVGLLLNVAAVAANGGHMPISPEAARFAGRYGQYVTSDMSVARPAVSADGQARLWLLTDIIGLPKEVPFATVWSIGDVLLTLGVAILCYRTMLARPGLRRGREPQLP
ncbi:MAG: DUF5317 domain-containing protein [Kouleothrix sp.]|nr:DUF5317 domain-containing protein [Kouleothrix sp.]